MTEFTNAETVGSYLKLPTGDASLPGVVEAVNTYITSLNRADHLDPEGDPTAAAQLAATMLAARLHRRRNSPFGTEAIDGTVASYIARYDPDIGRLLGLDSFAPPGVG